MKAKLDLDLFLIWYSYMQHDQCKEIVSAPHHLFPITTFSITVVLHYAVLSDGCFEQFQMQMELVSSDIRDYYSGQTLYTHKYNGSIYQDIVNGVHMWIGLLVKFLFLSCCECTNPWRSFVHSGGFLSPQ